MTKPTPTQTTAERIKEMLFPYDISAGEEQLLQKEIENLVAQAKREAREEVILTLRREKKSIFQEDELDTQKWKDEKNTIIDTLIAAVQKKKTIIEIDSFQGGLSTEGKE